MPSLFIKGRHNYIVTSGVYFLQGSPPPVYAPNNMLIHSGRFFTTLFVVRFTIGFLGHKARGTSTSRFAFFNTDGVGGQPPHSTEVIVSTVSIVFFWRSRKSALINALLRLFTWLCYNVVHWRSNQSVSNITQLHIKQLSQAVFLQWASVVRYTMFLTLCCAGLERHDDISPLYKGRFLFSPKGGILLCYVSIAIVIQN